MRKLGADEEWTKIHALSRSKKDKYPASVEHNHIDLTASPDELAKQLQGVQGDYLFFAAYLADDDEQKMCDLNGSMLRNFLHALHATGAINSLKRVVLVTGAKIYGVHLGVPKNPMSENDPFLEGSEWPPNFYYVQSHILKEEASKAGFDWTVTYPNDVIGVAKGNFMNLTTTLGLYCSVTKELGEATLTWPGSSEFYGFFDCMTDADLHADFCHWAATEPNCSNQAFNVVNGDAITFSSLWAKFAARFGLSLDPHDLSNPPKDPSIQKLAPHPPVSASAAANGLVDHFKQSIVEQRVNLVKWSQRANVKAAWDRLAEREGLEHDSFEKATWGFLSFVLGRNFNLMISMSKARKAGWAGYVDTWDAFEKHFGTLEEAKVLPKRK